METEALLVFDESGMGGLMFKEDLAMLRPRPRGFQFAGGKHKKLSILTSLKIFLDKELIVWPRSAPRISYELKRYKRTDEKEETDAVMAMAMASYWAERMARPNRSKEHLVTTDVYGW